MGGTTVDVDVEAVGGIVDHVGLGAHSVEHRTGDRRRRAVGTVQADLDALHREAAGGDEVGDVAVTPLHVVDGAADGVTCCERNLQLAVDVVLDLLEDVLVHLVALGVYELDPVVGIGVVRGRDHDAAIEASVGRLEGKARGGDDVKRVGVRSRGHETRDQRALEHVAGATRVLAQDDAGLAAPARAVVPTHIAPYLEGVVNVEPLVGTAAKAIGSKVLHERSFQSVSGSSGAVACRTRSATRARSARF